MATKRQSAPHGARRRFIMNKLEFMESTNESKGFKVLHGTTLMQTISANLTAKAFAELQQNDEAYDLFKDSQTDANIMDALVDKLLPSFADEDFSALAEIDNAEFGKMLASVQSKRCRLAKKSMTMDNYRSLLDAAICEKIIRTLTNRPKGSFAASGSVLKVFTDEELQQLSTDQFRLRAMIRNVQSRKSIAKKAEDFSEDSENWQRLLEIESQLKSIRTVVEPQTRGPQVSAEVVKILSDEDTDKMTKAQLLEVIAKIKDTVQ